MFGRKKGGDASSEWTKTGSFVHKPQKGWLHSDNSLMEGGVCYAVKVSPRASILDVHEAYIIVVVSDTADIIVFVYSGLRMFVLVMNFFVSALSSKRFKIILYNSTFVQCHDGIKFFSISAVCWQSSSFEVHANPSVRSSATSYKVHQHECSIKVKKKLMKYFEKGLLFSGIPGCFY